jgi:hypothetical protein
LTFFAELEILLIAESHDDSASDPGGILMKSLTRSFTHFLNSFLNACLLSFALTILLVGSNFVVAKGLAYLV